MMTKKQMEELADIVASKIIIELFGTVDDRDQAQAHFRNEFFKENTDNMEEEIPIGSIFPDMSTEELLLGEMARLQTILMIYEDREEYEKAHKVLKKLRLIQKKLGDQ
jgi:hypothetical protein